MTAFLTYFDPQPTPKKNTGMYLSFGNHIVHKPLYWNNFGQDCLNLFVSSSCTSMYKNMRHSESNKADT